MNNDKNNDLISRKWLTDAIRNRRTYLSYEDAKDIIDLIDNAPVFEERTSVWIVKTKSTFPQYQPDEYECPYCKKIVNHITNYCPECGTHMKGVTNNGEQ